MKTVLLSADGAVSAYEVPDIIANDLRHYCMEFCTEWLCKSPHAEKFRFNGVVCYDETDFIEYLNLWKFPKEPSHLIETIGWINSEQDIPEKYKGCERFNF